MRKLSPNLKSYLSKGLNEMTHMLGLTHMTNPIHLVSPLASEQAPPSAGSEQFPVVTRQVNNILISLRESEETAIQFLLFSLAPSWYFMMLLLNDPAPRVCSIPD